MTGRVRVLVRVRPSALTEASRTSAAAANLIGPILLVIACRSQSRLVGKLIRFWAWNLCDSDVDYAYTIPLAAAITVSLRRRYRGERGPILKSLVPRFRGNRWGLPISTDSVTPVHFRSIKAPRIPNEIARGESERKFIGNLFDYSSSLPGVGGVSHYNPPAIHFRPEIWVDRTTRATLRRRSVSRD